MGLIHVNLALLANFPTQVEQALNLCAKCARQAASRINPQQFANTALEGPSRFLVTKHVMRVQQGRGKRVLERPCAICVSANTRQLWEL